MPRNALGTSTYRRFYETVYRPDHPSNYGGVVDERITSLREATQVWLERVGVGANDLVLELGCGLG